MVSTRKQKEGKDKETSLPANSTPTPMDIDSPIPHIDASTESAEATQSSNRVRDIVSTRTSRPTRKSGRVSQHAENNDEDIEIPRLKAASRRAKALPPRAAQPEATEEKTDGSVLYLRPGVLSKELQARRDAVIKKISIVKRADNRTMVNRTHLQEELIAQDIYLRWKNGETLEEHERAMYPKCQRGLDGSCVCRDHIFAGALAETVGFDAGISEGVGKHVVDDLEYTGSQILVNHAQPPFEEPFDKNPSEKALALWPEPDKLLATDDLIPLLRELDDGTMVEVKSELTKNVLYDLPILIPYGRYLVPVPQRIHITQLTGKIIDTLMRGGARMKRDILPRVRGIEGTREDLATALKKTRTTLLERRQNYRDSIKGGFLPNFDPESDTFKEVMKPKSKTVLKELNFLFGRRFSQINPENKTYYNDKIKKDMPLRAPKDIPKEAAEGLKLLKVEVPSLRKFLKAHPEFKKYDPREHPLAVKKVVVLKGVVGVPVGGKKRGHHFVKVSERINKKKRVSAHRREEKTQEENEAESEVKQQ
ncbi:hypothetical protein EJ08DRAFT_692565 [Tothia fuscella]|uniref:Uncharacterized protein n=1 Tax=Tothia fuscella TaxID=1048955 RepID=A0A9P4P1N6_9PEZI|nr:hypothetical protein EJ08DRAFT_692565 [Tothia fuscella]